MLGQSEGLPAVGSLWEKDDEVYRVELVYPAKASDGNGGYKDITLVKVIVVEPAPWHCRIETFREKYTPYDPDAD